MDRWLRCGLLALPLAIAAAHARADGAPPAAEDARSDTALPAADADASPAVGSHAPATRVTPAAPALRVDVVDVREGRVRGIGLFAVDAGTARLRAWGQPTPNGAFVMDLPPGRYDFGLASAIWTPVRVVELGPGHLQIVAIRAFGDAPPQLAARDAKSWITLPVLASPEASSVTTGRLGGRPLGLLVGLVRDETGAALPGVQVIAAEPEAEHPTSVAVTDARGRFILATFAGDTQVSVLAPGLVLARARGARSGSVELTLAIDTGVEMVSIDQGHHLRFDMRDSLWIEYVPPPEVRAWLRLQYGLPDITRICPGDLLDTRAFPRRFMRMDPVGIEAPYSVWQRRCAIPKFWWLRVLHTPPPNPARGRPYPEWLYLVLAEMQAAETAGLSYPSPK